MQRRLGVCPFCEAVPEEMADHIRVFHKDRISAGAEYQRVKQSGGSEEAARLAYNLSLATKRPGEYDRSAFRRAS